MFGKTSEITKKPGITHLVGGMLDNNDINNNKDVNIYNTATRELKEELGISVNDVKIIKNVKGTYLITEDDTKSVGIVYKINLKINKKEMNELYNKFVKKLNKENKEIEFSNLEYIRKNIAEIEKYTNKNLHDEFIKELLKKDMM